MRPGRYDSLEFEGSKQDLFFMLREAEREVWSVLRGHRANSFKKMLELLLRAEQYVYLYLDGITITIQGNDGKGKKYILLIAYGVDKRGVKENIDFIARKSESYFIGPTGQRYEPQTLWTTIFPICLHVRRYSMSCANSLMNVGVINAGLYSSI